MKRIGLTTWLLLGSMTLLFSGTAGHAHQHDHGHAASTAHQHCNHDAPTDAPGMPLPADHDDCATCYLLVHLLASSLDLAPPVQLPQQACGQTSSAYAIIVSANTLRVPLGRGPPLSIPR